MLFAIKNHLVPTLLLAAALAVSAIAFRQALSLPWQFLFEPAQWRQLLLGCAVVAASDGVGHGLLWLTFQDRYREKYRALVEYFAPQRTAEILGAGALAATEELIFRGVLLEGLVTRCTFTSTQAIAISAVVFGLFHAIPRRRLLPFTLWAVWEGALLGWVYVMSGSLTVSVILHACHDMLGFALFRYQRATHWLL